MTSEIFAQIMNMIILFVLGQMNVDPEALRGKTIVLRAPQEEVQKLACPDRVCPLTVAAWNGKEVYVSQDFPFMSKPEGLGAVAYLATRWIQFNILEKGNKTSFKAKQKEYEEEAKNISIKLLVKKGVYFES